MYDNKSIYHFRSASVGAWQKSQHFVWKSAENCAHYRPRGDQIAGVL